MFNIRKLYKVTIIILVLFLTGCAEDEKDIASEEKQMDYITVEEFWEKTGLDKKDYSEIDIQQFIQDFQIDEDSIEELNVVALLEKYETSKDINNFGYLFNDDYIKRTGDYSEGIVRIAAVYNINTSIKSIMYDCGEKTKYYSDNGYIFNNINDATSCAYEDGEYQNLLDTMNDVDLFEWKDIIDSDDITDGQSFEVVIEYNDGSFFKVEFSGAIENAAPEGYERFKNTLFN